MLQTSGLSIRYMLTPIMFVDGFSTPTTRTVTAELEGAIAVVTALPESWCLGSPSDFGLNLAL